MEHFDFEEWRALAESDCDQFELKRAQWINGAIMRSKNSSRLLGLQWRIDEERKLSKTPLKSCLRLYALMWDSFMEQKSLVCDKLTFRKADKVIGHKHPSLKLVASKKDC